MRWADADRCGQLPKAVVVVDICGQSADWKAIGEVCSKYEIRLIADSAESFGCDLRRTGGGHVGGSRLFFV